MTPILILASKAKASPVTWCIKIKRAIVKQYGFLASYDANKYLMAIPNSRNFNGIPVKLKFHVILAGRIGKMILFDHTLGFYRLKMYRETGGTG